VDLSFGARRVKRILEKVRASVAIAYLGCAMPLKNLDCIPDRPVLTCFKQVFSSGEILPVT
jgi:hypothetical protein